MNLNVYYNKEADKTALKQANTDMGLMLDYIHQLELAIQYGRCLKCKCSLHEMCAVLCPDCNEEIDAEKNADAEYAEALQNNWDEIMKTEGIPGLPGPPPGITSDDDNSKSIPTNYKYMNLEQRIDVFNRLVDKGRIPGGHSSRLDICFLTPDDIDRLWRFIPVK